MSPLTPVAIFGLEIPPGDHLIPIHAERIPAAIHITMAAIDPSEEPEPNEEGNLPKASRATLKLIKSSNGGDLDSDEEDADYLQSLLGGGSDDGEEEANGGPSDPAKSKKARREAAIKKLLESTQAESDEEMEETEIKPNGVKSKKGKEKAGDDDENEKEEEDKVEKGDALEQYVVCTLDNERTYQQPIDICIGEGEKAFLAVSGNFSVHVTGNYVIHGGGEDSDDDSDDQEYDMPPGVEDIMDEDDESDVLDDIDGAPRVEEVENEDEEEAPKLVAANKKKGKNKRPAAEEGGLDAMLSEDKVEGEKLSKKQAKKLKNNKGEAVTAEAKAKDSPAGKSDKKVQFAKNLEQGPTGPAKDKNTTPAKKEKAASGVKVVQGVTIDDRKVGTGRTAKNGDKVTMRYIGKLQNGKVFDSNKKGTPFGFKLGKGEVIKGWDIGVAGMQIGGERRLTIPPHLAYGSKNMGDIPANSTLVFDIKLLEIK